MTTQLPPGWTASWDDSTGQWLYINVQTGAQQYEFPTSGGGDYAEQEEYGSDGDGQGIGGQEDNAAWEEGYEKSYGYALDTDVDTANAAQQDAGEDDYGYGDGDGGDEYAELSAEEVVVAQQSQLDELTAIGANDNDGMTDAGIF